MPVKAQEVPGLSFGKVWRGARGGDAVGVLGSAIRPSTWLSLSPAPCGKDEFINRRTDDRSRRRLRQTAVARQ